MMVVLIMGGAAVISGVSLLWRDDTPNKIGVAFAVLTGLLMIGVSVLYFAWALIFAAGTKTLAIKSSDRSAQPWLERPDWVARKVEFSSGGIAAGLWFWTLGWWSLLTFIGWINFDKILRAMSESWWNSALLAVFAGAGIIGLLFATWFSLAWLRFGTSILHLDTLPATLGAEFRGTLETRLQKLPNLTLEVELICQNVRWVSSGSGQRKATRLVVDVLGSERRRVEMRRCIPTKRGMQCPIEIQVPSTLPEYNVDDQGNGVRWVLSVNAAGIGTPYSCSFEVPIFSPR